MPFLQTSVLSRNMSLVDELEGIGSFLVEAQQFPATFEKAKQRQLTQAVAMAKSQQWTPKQAAEAMRVLQQQTAWTGEERQQLVAAIEAGMDGFVSTPCASTGKMNYQDFTALPHYLTKEQWTYLQTDTESDANKAMKLGEMMGKLGCRLASEGTWSYITALLFGMPGCKFAQQNAQDLHSAYVFTKKYGRQLMAAMVPGDRVEIPLVERLPQRWQEHDPRLLADALGDEKPAGLPVDVNLTKVAALARSIPCRISKHGFKPMLWPSTTTVWPSAGSSSIWQPTRETPFAMLGTHNKMDLLKHLVGEMLTNSTASSAGLHNLQIFPPMSAEHLDCN